jgi:polyisoprenoid-binding protein YceI
MKKFFATAAILSSLATPSWAADYDIDVQGAHAFINFKVSHLGYSWVTGRFNKFDGNFSYDPDNLAASTLAVKIDTTSFDSNHAQRDKHIRGDDFLDAGEFPEASFVSKSIEGEGDNFIIHGDFTMKGMTKPLAIRAKKIGEGKDPWGGYRAGFEGTAELNMADWGFKMDFGKIYLELVAEGIRRN